MDIAKHASGRNERELFMQAVDQPTPAERAAYLDAVCGNDTSLRLRLQLLLERSEKADTFLEKPVVSLPAGKRDSMTLAGESGAAGEQTGDRIGRYKLLEKIGEGGCGVVYHAEQEAPVRRRVALKVIKLGMDTRSVITRFEAERQAVALMDHPNIAKVFDAGATEAGRPFFVMELVRGIKITEYCDQHNLSTPDRLDLFIKVCQAIQHAHQKGIIHRDIKPSNILVTRHDGVAVPKVIDFGIAKATSNQRLTDRTFFTALEQFIGTPAYMSPEQAEMSGLDIDTRSDIYSLGVLLYEMLTGKTPFDAKDLLASGLDEMRRIIREKEPARPITRISQTYLSANPDSRLSTQRSALSTDLDWIVLKCLEKDRSRRYETAYGLAKDIERFTNNEPITARPPSAAYKIRKFVGRNKTSVATGAAIALILMLATVVSTWQAFLATRAQQKAVEAQKKEAAQHRVADEALALARKRFYAAEMAEAFETFKSDNLGRTRELLAKQQLTETSAAHNPESSIDLRGWEWRHLWHRTRGEELFTLAGHSNEVTAALFLNDGGTIVSASYDGTLRFWDVQKRTNTLTVPIPGDGPHLLSLSPDGRWLAVGGDPWLLFDTTRRQWAYAGTNSGGIVVGLAFSHDNQQLALGTGAEIRLLDVASRRTLKIIDSSADQAPMGDHIGLAFSPDGRRLAYGHMDLTIRLTDLVTGSELIMAPTQASLSLVFIQDGRFLISGGGGGLDVWDTATGKLTNHLLGHRAEVAWVSVSPDGQVLATASADQTVRLWDTISWKELRMLRGHEMGVSGVAFSSSGEQLVSVGRDERLRVWDVRQRFREEKFVSADNAPLNWPFALGERVVLVHGNLPYAPPVVPVPTMVRKALQLQGNQGSVSYLNCATLEESEKESTPSSFSSAQVMAFGLNAESVAVGWPNGRIEFWTTQPFRQVRVIVESTNAPIHLALGVSGRRLSVHRSDDTVEIWNPLTGALELRLPALGNLFGGPNCEFWANDRIMARFSMGWRASPPLIELWSLPEGRRRVFAHPKGGVWTQAISHDGQLLASSGFDGVLRLWEVEGERQINKITGQLQTYYSLVFSPDDLRLVGGGFDGTITMWDLTTRQQIAHWKAHERQCALLRFVGPNQDLISLGDLDNKDRYQGEIRLWRAPSLAQIDAQAKL